MGPDLAGMFADLPGPTPDPLSDVELTGDLEVDALAEIDALQTAFVKRRLGEDKRFRDATDSEFWFAVCFRTRDEKEAFLAALPGEQLDADKYLNGADLAKRLGLTIGDTDARDVLPGAE